MLFNFKVPYDLEHVEVSANEEFYNIYTYKVQYLIIYMKQSDTLLYQFFFFFKFSEVERSRAY